MKYYFLVLCFLVLKLSAQQNGHERGQNIDSLLTIYKNSPDDTLKAKFLIRICNRYLADADYTNAIKYAELCVDLSKKLKFVKGQAAGYNSLGTIYYSQANYPKALDNNLKTLKLKQQIGDVVGAAGAMLNISNVYGELNNYQKTLSYVLNALDLFAKVNEKRGVGFCLQNVGQIYSNAQRYDSALFYLKKGQIVLEEIGDEYGLSNVFGNLGLVYGRMGDMHKAMECLQKGLAIKHKIGDIDGEIRTLLNLGDSYREIKDYKTGEKYLLEAIEQSGKIGARDITKAAREKLCKLYGETGNAEKELEQYKLFIVLRDSIYNEENTKKLVRSEMNFEFEKKEAATKLEQEKKEMIAAAESKKQKIIIYSVCGILLLVICFAAFAYRSYLQKQKANLLIIRQKHVIEEKQKEILDSIYYAKRIQTALLPTEKYISRNIK